MNNKIITKTSKQAKLENEKIDVESICPECGTIGNFYIFHYEKYGLFKKLIKVKTYTCFKCSCEWEIRRKLTK